MNEYPNDNKQQTNDSSESDTAIKGANGIVTVNDDNNPTREERDARIANEPDTERLRSERQSIEEGKRSSNSL